MSKRWIALSPLILFCSILSSCNRPQISGDASLPVEEDVVDCSYQALLEMFVENPVVTLSPGCVYEIPRAEFHAGGMSTCFAALPIIKWSGYVIHGNGATLRRAPAPDNESWQNDFRFIYIDHAGSLEIDNLTLEGGSIIGNDSPCDRQGGAILSNGSLTVRDSHFIGNYATTGGAISMQPLGSLVVENSTFEGNSSSAGGAINNGSPEAQISDSIFRNNYAGSGGAIRSIDSIVISNSQFDGNSSSGKGGAILNEASMTIYNSSITNNSAAHGGGGIYGGGVIVENSTISGNHRGGIDTSSYASISYSTIVNNVNGSGINSGSTPSTFNNNIIAYNHPYDCYIESNDGGGDNLDTDGTCPGTIITADPVIGPLTNNGGASLTHALLMGSPAIDTASGDCPEADQRGIPRPEGSSCDLGAFEWGEIGMEGYTLNAGELLFSDPSGITGDVLLPEGSDEPSRPSHTGRIEEAVPCYNGPGPMYAVVSSLQPGALVEIIGISENGDYIVILNPCYPGVPCWAEEGSIEIHDQLDPSQVIPDPALPEDEEEETSGGGSLVCQPDMQQPECEASGGTWSLVSPPPCKCP